MSLLNGLGAATVMENSPVANAPPVAKEMRLLLISVIPNQTFLCNGSIFDITFFYLNEESY